MCCASLYKMCREYFIDEEVSMGKWFYSQRVGGREPRGARETFISVDESPCIDDLLMILELMILEFIRNLLEFKKM